jgi:hypothetical protein
MKPETLTKIIRPAGLLICLATFLVLSILCVFALPLERESIADSALDGILTLTLTWATMYISSRGVEKSIQISRNQNKVD